MTSDDQVGDRLSDLHTRRMNVVAHMLDDIFNGKSPSKRICFTLLITEFDDRANRVNYISNGERADVVMMLKQILSRFEAQPRQSGRA